MKLDGLDLNLLLVFDALGRARHLTRAGLEIGLSQPAMSHALARLRRRFDDALFVPTPRGLVPTTRAAELAAPVARALARLTQALEPPPPFDPRRLARRFTVTMSVVSELALLPALTARLAETAPGVEVRVLPVAPPEEALADRRVDIAFSRLDRRARGPHHEYLYTQHMVAVVRRANRRVGRRATLAQFLGLAHVNVEPRGLSVDVLDEILAARGLERRVALWVADFVTAARVAACTDHVATIPSVAARVFLPLLPLRQLQVPLAMPEVRICQFWRERDDGDPAHRFLRAELVRAARAAEGPG
jgi:DNA-binding transcriptional LysR family regulator